VENGAWTETVLHSFTNKPDGDEPGAPVVISSSGALYGTTAFGGSGAGIVFALLPPKSGSSTWTEEILHAFGKGQVGDGEKPTAPVAIGRNGALYGTTVDGGQSGDGTAFELKPPTVARGAWTELVIWSFTGSDGERPLAGLSIGANGALYGTTSGSNSPRKALPATVFELSPPADQGGQWTETVICSFATGGEELIGTSVLIGKNGVLYATTWGGDSSTGLILELTPLASPGGIWTQTILFSFNSANGSDPGQLTLVGGAFYGYYLGGSDPEDGAVFELQL
jgi:hypothetical protein